MCAAAHQNQFVAVYGLKGVKGAGFFAEKVFLPSPKMIEQRLDKDADNADSFGPRKDGD